MHAASGKVAPELEVGAYLLWCKALIGIPSVGAGILRAWPSCRNLGGKVMKICRFLFSALVSFFATTFST